MTTAEADYDYIYCRGFLFRGSLLNNFIEVLFKLQIVILALFLFAPVVVSILFGI